MRFLLVTDFHLRDPEGSAAALAQAELVKSGLDLAAGRYPDAHFCVINGDIADAGEEATYRWLRAVSTGLPFKVVPLLGNHDERSAFRKVFPGEGNFAQSYLDAGGVRCLFLDTHEPGTDAGHLCAERLAWVRKAAAGADGRPVLIFLHHPPCDIGDPSIDPSRLGNPEDLARALDGANVVRLFFGHVHRTIVTTWNGVPAIGLARPVRDLPILVSTVADGRVESTLAGSR